MNEFRLSPEAEAQLDSTWLHIVRQSGSIDTANRVIDYTADRF
jgi:plasmid stabilization system protein ParE